MRCWKCVDCNNFPRREFTERELDFHMKRFHKVGLAKQVPQPIAHGCCPDCGSTLFFQEGCVKCSCGFSQC